MSLRVCLVAGCPELTDSTRCHAHTRAKDRARGTRQARGYDATHTRLRKQWVPIVAAGAVHCTRCHQLITKGQAWDLGHDDDDRSAYTGPEHARCNRATAGR